MTPADFGKAECLLLFVVCWLLFVRCQLSNVSGQLSVVCGWLLIEPGGIQQNLFTDRHMARSAGSPPANWSPSPTPVLTGRFSSSCRPHQQLYHYRQMIRNRQRPP